MKQNASSCRPELDNLFCRSLIKSMFIDMYVTLNFHVPEYEFSFFYIIM